MLHEKLAEPGVIQNRTSATRPRVDEDRLDLRELLQVLKQRRAWILWTTALLICATLAYAIFATPLYTASTQILIDPRDRHIVNNEVSPGNLSPDGGIAVVESQLLVITSDTVLRRAIAREDLALDPEFGGLSDRFFAVLLRHGLAAIGIDLEAADRRAPELKALRQLKRRIGVKRSDKAFVVDIYVTTDSKDKSVRVADAVVQSYLTDQAESRAQAARQASVALTSRLEELRKRVQDAENRVEQYKAQHNIVGANGVLVSEQQLTEITNQLNNARARAAEARARVEQIDRLRRSGAEPGAIPEAVQSLTIGQLRVQYAEVVRQRADLGARLGPRHPTIATLEAQVRDLHRMINDELSRIGAAARGDLERAVANEQSLERSLEGLKGEIVSTRQAFVRLRELEREVEASRAVYEAFLVRARETSEQQTIDSTNARIISTATPPYERSWPPRTLLLAIALVAGLGFGTGLGLLREYFDDTIRSRRQLQELTGAPVLAAFPDLSRRGQRRKSGDTGSDESVGRGDARAAAAFAASIRRLREVLRDLDMPRRGRVVLISSTTAGEGKTSVALALARAAAADGERVLLVDADVERRTASKLFEADGKNGLCELLEGHTILSLALINDEKTGVNFLPAGGVGRAVTRRPGSVDILQRFIEPARSFDLTIIDGGSMTTDAYVRGLADVVDDIIFLVRAGSTRAEDVLTAFEAFRVNARKIRGTAMTAAAVDAA